MRCVECQPQIEAYFDNELDEQTNLSVAQHLKACASCARLLAGLEGEQELFLLYECDAEPSPEFWDNVILQATAREAASQSARPPSLLRDWLVSAFGNFNARRFSPSLTALLVVVAIGLTVGVMRFLSPRGERNDPESISQNKDVTAKTPAAVTENTVASATPQVDDRKSEQGSGRDASEDQQPLNNRPGKKSRLALTASNENLRRAGLRAASPARSQTPDELVREAEQKYVAAITLLSRDVNRRRSRLDAETIARFERTLAAVDRTIADTRQAARRHPGDPVAAQYMLTAYARKVDVLREMVGY
jgi:hypothetical protein